MFETQASIFLVTGFIVLTAAMLAGFVYIVRSKPVSFAVCLWALLTGVLAYSGSLNDFSTSPPRLILIFVPTLAGVMLIAFFRVGKSLANYSFTFLVGFQSFRIIVELLIHQAVTERVAPPQMTWTGYNLDIITGVTALILIPFANKLPKMALHFWNVMGAGLLILVVSVAIVSMPTAFQQLKPDNTWVAHFPFVWLPVVFVSAALLGHLVLFRKLIADNGKIETELQEKI